jgi:hypothetical protein
MRHALVCGMALVGFVAGAGAQDEPVVLKRADLEKLAGTWQLKADAKEGWRGTVRVTVSLFPADGKAADFARLLYDFDLANGGNKYEASNYPAGGVAAGALRRGKTDLLVTYKDFGRRPPFKLDPADGVSAPFELKGDTLSLDMSKSGKAFLPGSLAKLQIDWAKSTWERVKAK